MVKFRLLSIVFLFSCSVPVTKFGNETILKKPEYQLNSFRNNQSSSLIDTLGIYININNDAGLVHHCLHFHSNGSFVEVMKFNELFLTKNDFQVHPHSVRRGRYILEGNNIKVEMFYPGEPSPFRSGWYRQIHSGKVSGDTIQLKLFEDTLYFIKSKEWVFDGKELVYKKQGRVVKPKLDKPKPNWWEQ